MNIKKASKITGKVILWILGIWIGLLIIIQIVLLPPIFTRIANSLANKYVNADVSIGRAYGSVLRQFPRISFEVEDLEITYPHERFDSVARAGAQNHLLYRGCGQEVDTLASIKRLSASITLTSLLSGNVKLPDIEVESPRIYAHSYGDGHANWNIFGSSGSSAPKDTSAVEKPKSESSSDEGMNIIFRKISINGKPEIIYTDSQDSLFVRLGVKSIGFDGNFETNAIHRTLADAHITKLSINGNYGADSLSGEISKMALKRQGGKMYMDIKAHVLTEMDDMGMQPVPIMISGDLAFPKDDGTAISLKNIKADVATIPGEGDIDVKLRADSTVIDGRLDINSHKIQMLLNAFAHIYAPDLGILHTDTEVTVHARADGAINSSKGTLPEILVDIDIPDSKIDSRSFPDKITIGLSASARMDKYGQLYADISRTKLKTSGLNLYGYGGTIPLGNTDREINIDGNLDACLDSLRAFLPDTMDIVAKGGFTLALDGTIKMSDLGMYKFSRAGLNGHLDSDSMILRMPEDSIDVTIDGLDIRLMPEYVSSKREPDNKIRLMGISGTLGSADIQYKDEFAFQGKNLDFAAKNSTDNDDTGDEEVSYLGGRLNAKLLNIEDSEGTSIKLDETNNRFQMRPDRRNPAIPILSLSNENLRITYVTPDNRIILTDSRIKAKSKLNTFDRKARREAMLDSLSKVYPEIPRDSLWRHARSLRGSKRIGTLTIDDDDFKEQDVKININETARKYFREWDMSGDVEIRTGIIMTPYFPLRNIIRGAEFSFTNDQAKIDSIKIMAGESELCAKGGISNLKTAMLRNDTLKIDLDISSSSVDADELLKAYSIGSQYQSKTETQKESEETLTNAEFFKQVTTDTVRKAETRSALFIIPGNITADIGIRMSGMKYQDLDISKFSSDIIIKDRCAQMTGTTLRSNMGNASFDAFYAVRSKEDIKSGFCLDLENVTSARVISMMPEIGEIIPMIGSLNGLLNCEVAATADLDTTMSIRMNTVNGIARLGGKDLTISDDPVYTSIARKLLFKNKRKGEIKELMIEGKIKDSSLEIFPFILKLDRYTLGLSGIQNMDMSYKHHISVLRSPLLIRLGLNISGPDYDHMKFRIGKAKYRIKKIPSFTAVIDQTKNDLRYSIYNLFETGVNQTIANSDVQSLINEYETNIGYVNAANLELEELDEKELSEFQEMEAADSMVEDAMTAAMAAIQEALKKHKYE